MARVELEHVEKVYPNGTHALADCTLAVADGELLVLVGPSGCGKSTVLRLVAGLEEVTSGTVRIGDTVVNALSPQARNVAMVFQDYALYPHMSVRGNLEFPLRMRKLGRAAIDERVRWIAQLLDLQGLLDRLPKQLSGGQRQRVAMGRALVRQPAVSLLDEPLSNLDAKLRVQVRAEIAELQRRTATTMLYVTHDQVEAMTLGERVAVMHQGRVQQVAAPGELYDRPATTFVAGFIGNPPMNLFPARLRPDERGGAVLALGDGGVRLSTERVPGALRGRGERAVTAGIRPEALALVSDSRAPSDGEDALRAHVEHVEWLGHETLAYVRVADPPGADGLTLVARLPGMQTLHKDDDVRLAVDAGRLHFFDADGQAFSR